MIYYGKNHWYMILINFFELIKKLWALIILIIVPSLAGGLIIPIILFCLIAGFCFIKWFNEYIVITEEYVLYKRGVFRTKNVKIPISSISLVEFNRNIIHIILGLRRVKLESISPKDKNFDVTMVLKINKIIEFQKTMSYVEHDEIDENEIKKQLTYKVSAKHLVILSTLRSNIILGIGTIYSLIHFLIMIDKRLKFDLKQFFFDIINKNLFKNFIFLDLLIYLTISIMIAVVIIMAFSIISIIFKYYRFKISRQGKYVYVEHGLFVRKKYSIKIEKIHAIKIEQNLINQILGLYTLKGAIVGFGNNASEGEILFPLCDELVLKNIITFIVPEFNFKGEIQEPPKRAFNNFYVSWTIWAFLLGVLILVLTNGDFAGFIIVPITVLWRYLLKKNSQLGISDDILYFSSRSFIRRIILVRASSVIECSQVINLFQRRKNICDYRMQFYNQKPIELIRVKNMEDNLYEKIKEKINSKITT